MKVDGRKIRWIDCDWNNDGNIPNGCEKCLVCKYRNFLDWAQSVGGGGIIQYNKILDEYSNLKTKNEKLEFIAKNLKTFKG